jgi:hypothetical protein
MDETLRTQSSLEDAHMQREDIGAITHSPLIFKYISVSFKAIHRTNNILTQFRGFSTMRKIFVRDSPSKEWAREISKAMPVVSVTSG